MKISKYFPIDSNILIEYIYDDSNLIGEPYNILYNSRTNTKCFISSDELKPAPRGYKSTSNDLYNQLYKIDQVQGRYGKIPTTNLPNTINSNLSFLQIRNFSTSIPVRYDIIKVHIPVDYTFGDNKGFYLRSYTYDYDHKTVVELSNYYFNITDIEQNYKLMYSSPIQIINEKQWGKYLQIQIPSVTKVSDQRVNGLTQSTTKENSINFNLTDGKGLSKNSPIFFDFFFINSIDTVGGSQFMNLGHRITFTTPQTPEFEKIGVRIEESTQGDFFLIYGTYNNTIAEFDNFIEDSYYNGNRYYAEFTVETYEKNVKTKTNTFVQTEDFSDEIEFRPILKFTTTTAVIDVTLRLIDSVDGTFIERKASYGMLQGGGSRMGGEPNPRLGTGNKSGGAGDISRYSKSSTKINLKYAKRPEVYNVKSTILPNTSDNPFGTKPILKLKKLAFNLFSSNYYFIDSNDEAIIDRAVYVPNNNSVVYILPYDNILNISVSDDQEMFYNLQIYEDLKMIIKADKKDIEVDIYRDSSENDFENGKIVFRVPESKYLDIKKAHLSGYDIFYITGIDENGLKKIIYSSFYLPWDTVTNIQKLENDYISNQQRIKKLNEPPVIKDITKDVKDAIKDGLNKATTVNSNPITNTNNQDIKNNQSVNLNNLKWKASKEAIQIGIDLHNFMRPKDTKNLEMLMIKYGINILERISSKSVSGADKSLVQRNITKNLKSTQSQNQKKIELLLGYFKGVNIEPEQGIKLYHKYWETKNSISIINSSTKVETALDKVNKKITIDQKYYESLREDLMNYINAGLSGKYSSTLIEKEIKVGEFLPVSKKERDLIRSEKVNESKTQVSQSSTQNIQTKTDSTNIEQVNYPPNTDIPRGGKKSSGKK